MNLLWDRNQGQASGQKRVDNHLRCGYGDFLLDLVPRDNQGKDDSEEFASMLP
jgi:hypothetical protein